MSKTRLSAQGQLLSKTVSTRAKALMGAAVLAALGGSFAPATTLTWDNDGTPPANGGTGTWDTSSSKWFNGSIDTTWSDGSDAVFPAAVGTVTLATGTTRTANSITFTATSSNYVITGGTALNITSPTSTVLMQTSPTTANGMVINTNIGNGTTDFTVLNNYTGFGATNGSTSRTLLNLGGSNAWTGNLILGGTGFATANGNANQVSINTGGALPSTANVLMYRNFSQLLFTAGTAAGNSNTAYTATFSNNINLNALGADAGMYSSQIGTTASGCLITLSGLISGTSDFIFGVGLSGGQGTMILSHANNTWTGQTKIIETGLGILRLGVDNALPQTTTLNFAGTSGPDGAFDMAGHNQTVAAFKNETSGTINGVINTTSTLSTLTINGNATTTARVQIGIPTVTAITGATDNIALVLASTNTGSLSLINATGSTYNGGTTINGGTLLVTNTSNSGTGSGAVTVGAGGTLGGTGRITGAVTVSGKISPGTSVGTLTLTNGLSLIGGSSGNFEFSSTPANDKITVSGGTLAMPGSGTFAVNLFDLGNGIKATGGTNYVLFNYAGATLAGDPVATMTVTPPTSGLASLATFGIVNNTTSSTIELTVSGILGANITWKGDVTGSGTWDVGTTANFDNAGAVTYKNPDGPTFDDSANGSGTVTVTIDAGGVAPGSVAFANATRDYILQGGAITGTTSITKTLAGKLIINNANSFTSRININGGEVDLNNANGLGSGGDHIVFHNAAVLKLGVDVSTPRDVAVDLGGSDAGGVIDTNGFTLTSARLTDGNRNVVKQGLGTWNMNAVSSSVNMYTGTLSITAGKLKLSATNANGFTGIGEGTVNINSGGTLELANINVSTTTNTPTNANGGPFFNLNDGGTLLATGTDVIERNSSVSPAIVLLPTGTVGSPLNVHIATSNASDQLTFAHVMQRQVANALVDTLTAEEFTTIQVDGPGTVLLGSGSTPRDIRVFAGSWQVNNGILQMGPNSHPGIGTETLNALGYKNNDPKQANTVTVSGGILAGGTAAADVANGPTTIATGVDFYRAGIVMAGGSLASVGVNANYGGDFTTQLSTTSTVLVSDPVASNTARDVNLVAGTAGTNNNAAATTWNGNLVISLGSSSVGGAFNINRTGGTITVTSGATLTVNPGTTVNLGGTADALSDGTNFVNVVNNSTTSFNVTAGAKNIGNLSGVGNTNIAASSSLTVHQTADATGYGTIEGAGSFTKDGTSSLSIAHARVGSLTVSAGTLAITSTATGSTPSLEAGNNSATSVVSAISITGGKLDLTNNDLIVRVPDGPHTDTARALVEGYVASGFRVSAGADWNGTGIMSSTAASHVAQNFPTALGVLDHFQLPSITSFGGQTVGANDILVKYTWNGDATMDGVVNADDYNKFLDGFVSGMPARWFNGDFTYDGVVNADDYNFFLDGLLAYNASAGVTLSPAFEAQLAEFATANGIPFVLDPTPAPEPTSLGVLSIASAGMLARRRRNA